MGDYRQEMLAIQELAGRMADAPDDVLPRFVDLAMEITGAVSGGISLHEAEPYPGVFRWRFLRGTLAAFENALTPRNFSPCGVTLDQQAPVLSRHPERAYDWISEHNIVVPEVLLVPLYIHGSEPVGTLWIVAEREGHFSRGHARAMTELASFVGIALRMAQSERKLTAALEEQETLAREMSHRVKNLFAITDGMIRASARSAVDKDSFAKALSGRLHALASAHTMVSRNLRDVGTIPLNRDISSLLETILRPHDLLDDAAVARIQVRGPAIRCGEHALNGLALVVHELATNAAKYGALASEAGRIDVEWREDGADLLIAWHEHCGPRIEAPPQRTGLVAPW